MQNEPNVKRKKEEFNKVSGPLPNQQSSNIDEQQTKVNVIIRQLFISDYKQVCPNHRDRVLVTTNKDQAPGKGYIFSELQGAVISPWDSIFIVSSCISPLYS